MYVMLVLWLFMSTFLYADVTYKKLTFNELLGWKTATIKPVFKHYSSLIKVRTSHPAKNASNKELKRWVEQNFEPVMVSSTTHSALITGYHIYNAPASREETTRYSVPLYQHPKQKGVNHRVSYQQIMDGALEDKGLEIAWLKHESDRYLLMMQGSGIISYEDGQTQSVVYAGGNGFKYRSISDYMIEKGYITEEQRNGPTIKAFLKKEPQLATDILVQNPSFVFFKMQPDSVKFTGAAGSTLVARKSLAIDKQFYPQHSLFWVQTHIPNEKGRAQKWTGLMIAQDTGGAIKGPQRADIYFGHLPEAENVAGFMKDSDAKLIYLKPKHYD